MLKISPEIEETSEFVYDQPPILQALPSKAIVMCVGHEPYLGRMSALMLCGNHSPSLLFKTAGSALIIFQNIAMIGKGILE